MELNLPLKVLNRLRLGRNVAAEVQCEDPDRRMWIMISPVIAGRDPDESLFIPVISYYRIAYFSVMSNIVHRLDEEDLSAGQGSVQLIVVENENEVGAAIAGCIHNVEDLRDPSNVPDSDFIYEKVCTLFGILCF